MENRKTKEELVQFLSDLNEENGHSKMNEIASFFAGYSNADWDYIWNCVDQSDNDRMKVVMLWEALVYAGSNERYEHYLDFLKKTDAINWAEKYFMLWQVSARLFANAKAGNFACKKYMYEIYHNILCDFKSNFNNLEYITDRNASLVLVTVQQFLNMMHGPTKTALDRALCLKRNLGKEVVIVNTAELLGGCPLEIVDGSMGNYDNSLTEQTQVEYMGEKFAYIQFDNNMPNISNSLDFIDFIKQTKPGYIVNIGGESLLVDTCSSLVPVLNINTVPSDIDRTEATMQVVGHKVSDADEQMLNIIGKSKNDVIVGRFTSSLKEQTHKYTRQEFGIPDDRMVLAVVGGRLTTEADDEFIRMLDKVLEKGAFVVIIGRMDTYDEMCRKDAVFAGNSRYLGLQEDVLAVLDCCDMYVNPKRTGGGTSVIEAMYKGLPAVSLNCGDVALGAGKDFLVNDYSDMQDVLLKYMTDDAFYSEMSEKAKKHADYMLDSASAFKEIIEQFEQRVKLMDGDADEEIVDPSELIVQGKFDKALPVINECIKNDSNNYEWYYMSALCYENLNQVEMAYFCYKFALFLGEGSVDAQILKDGFENLCSYADASAYKLGKACQDFMQERLKLREYDKSHEFLMDLLYNQNIATTKVVLTEENSLIFMMLEIVLCERNSMTENEFKTGNTCIRFHNDVYEFKNVYRKIKLMARRIWFGFDLDSQKEINSVLDEYDVSGDMLAVIVKYSVKDTVWQDAFARLNAAIQYKHPAQAQIIMRYCEWLKRSGIGGDEKCDKPQEYDNHAEVIRIDCTDTVQKKAADSVGNDFNKIAFIFCTNDELYSSECVRYLKRLIVPRGMTLQIIQVWNAGSMAHGYNVAMNFTDAAYKVYIHHDTFIIDRKVLFGIMECFKSKDKPDMIGLAGSVCLSDNGCWWQESKDDMRMSIYQDAELNILNSRSIKTNGILENADAIDGIFIATSKDVTWREDLFDNWHFYDISQCYEFRRHGLKTMFYNSDKMVLLHETTMKKDPQDLYEKYRQIFVNEYKNKLPILVYKGDAICYGVLNFFEDQFIKSLKSAGENVEVYDIAKEDINGLTRFIGRKFKAIVGFQTYVFSIYLKSQNKYLHDLIEGPKYNFVFDHPIWMQKHLDINLSDYHVLTLDGNYAEFTDRFYKGVKASYVLPPGGSKNADGKDDTPVGKMEDGEWIDGDSRSENMAAGDMRYEINFIGTYTDYRKYLKVIAQLGSNRCLAVKMLYYLKNDPALTPEKALRKSLDYYDVHCDDAQFLKVFAAMKAVVFCIMAYYREKVVLNLVDNDYDFKLHVFGDSWKAFKKRYNCEDRMIIHDAVSVKESLKIMNKSDISLNVMAWHKDGFTERIANAMLNRSLVLTDRSTAVERECNVLMCSDIVNDAAIGLTDAADVVEYDLDNLDILAESVDKLLKNKQLCAKITDNAYKKAEEKFTWDARVRKFLELL